jgi:putative hydrolase of the HAD superfamily
MVKPDIDTILFDLGGVLIELGDLSTLFSSAGFSIDMEAFWRHWLTSPSVRRFESGRISPVEFGKELVEELSLDIDPDQFMAAFTAWPVGPYPGAVQLLISLSLSYRVGSLSNTNALHWDRFDKEMDLVRHFDVNYPSFLTGRLKPEPETFSHVASMLGVPPRHILFLDDNNINVDGALSAGMLAYRARGVEGAKDVLLDLGILTLY